MEGVEDLRPRLVDGGDDGMTHLGQVGHVLHHVQRCKAVQSCTGRL